MGGGVKRGKHHERTTKKVYKNKKADAVPLAVLIVAIIVIAGLAYVFTGSGSTEYWETEAEFGVWQDELYIEFADGTTESLKLIEEGRDKPFAVKYNNKVITKIGLRITAAISGSGFTGAELKFESFGARREIRTSSGTLKKTYDSMRSDGIIQIAMGQTQNILTTEFNLDTTINQNPNTYPNGLYMVKFVPMGSVKYRGYPDGGDWVTASLPPLRFATITVMHTPTGSIVVTLGSELTSS